MIKPCGHRVLVRQDKLEEIDEAFQAAKRIGIQIIETEAKREQNAVDTGVVVAVGDTAWEAFGGQRWAKVGDRISFAKYAGKVVTDVDDTKYVVLNDEDVICVYE